MRSLLLGDWFLAVRTEIFLPLVTDPTGPVPVIHLNAVDVLKNVTVELGLNLHGERLVEASTGSSLETFS